MIVFKTIPSITIVASTTIMAMILAQKCPFYENQNFLHSIINSPEIKDKCIYFSNFLLLILSWNLGCFLPINNIFRMEVEKCGCNFGCIKTSLGLFESLLLLNMIHQIATVYELHHKIQPTGSLESRIKFSQKGRLKKVFKYRSILTKLSVNIAKYVLQSSNFETFINLTLETVKSRLILTQNFWDNKKRSLLKQLKTVRFQISEHI